MRKNLFFTSKSIVVSEIILTFALGMDTKNDRRWIYGLVMVLMACHIVVGAFAARAKIEWKTYTQPDGTVLTLTLCGDEHFHCYRDTEGRFFSRDSLGVFSPLTPDQVRQASARTRSNDVFLTYPHTSWEPDRIYRQLVVLVSFSDCDFSMENPSDTYNAIFNEPGYNQQQGLGSVADYFRDQSGGMFNLQFDVYGPIKVSSKAQSSSSAKNYGRETFREATQNLIAEHPEIDYSPYDWNNDGIVDQVIFIYAGLSGNTAGATGYIWPNTWTFTTIKTPDGYKISNFSASAERWTASLLCGIGTICHEYSHCLGLPDIYPTSTSVSAVSIVDEWDLMDGGNYTNRGWCPPNYSPLEKMLMGWLTPEELNEDTDISGMKPVADGGKAYLIRHTDNEFYLVENRQWQGWDLGLPGHGLMVYHVKYDQSKWENNAVNNTNGQPYYCLVPADNLDYNGWIEVYTQSGRKSHYINGQMMNSIYLSTAAYPWHTDSTTFVNRELTATSVPAAQMYDADADGSKMLTKSLTNITEHEDGTISFSFRVNRQTEVKVADIIAITNYIAGKTTGEVTLEEVDVNRDGVVNVADIIAVVNMICSQ